MLSDKLLDSITCYNLCYSSKYFVSSFLRSYFLKEELARITISRNINSRLKLEVYENLFIKYFIISKGERTS